MALTKVTRDLLNTGIDDNSTSTAITIDSSNRVSINTTSATELLNVAHTSGNGAGVEFAGNGNTIGSTSAFYGQGSGSDAYVWNRASSTVLLGTNNTERLRIGPAGQIGLSGANYGTSGQVLTSNGGSSAPTWQDASGGGNIDGTTINPSSVQIGGTTVINSSRELRNLHGTMRSDSTFKMVTEAGAAQLLQTQGVAAGTSYSATPAYQGEFNALNGYRVGNTAVIDSSRNLTNMGTGAFSGNVKTVYTGNSDNDSGVYVNNDASDWGIKITKVNSDNYGMLIESSGTYAFAMRDSGNVYRVRFTGTGDGVFGGTVTADRFYSGVGTAASPAFQVGDTNTGLFDSGSNRIAVACNGAAEFDFGASRLDMMQNRLDNVSEIQIVDANTKLNEGSGNSVRIQTNSGYVDIGPMNTTWCHFQTDRGKFYFEKQITVDSGIVSSYNENLVLRRADNSNHQLSIGQGVVTTSSYIYAQRLYASSDGTVGYFFNDTGTRTAYAGGDFYIQSIDNYYNYATSQYMGASSGDTIYVRGNRMTHNGWDFQANGHIRMYDNYHIRFGTGGDAEFFCNGSHMYIDLNSGIGNLYIRDGSTTRYTFNDNGNFTATGNVTAYSDRRVKDQFEPITDALAKVQQLNGQTYVRTDMDDDDRRYAGLIAQDVEAVLPEAVTEIEDHLALDYSGTIALLVEAIKELKQEVKDLKSQLEDR